MDRSESGGKDNPHFHSRTFFKETGIGWPAACCETCLTGSIQPGRGKDGRGPGTIRGNHDRIREIASFFILRPAIHDGDRLQFHPTNFNLMAHAPYSNLEATPDFATFQFISPSLPESTVRQVRFNGHQGGRIYHVEFRNGEPNKKDAPNWPDSRDFLCTVLTTLQIIEIYSERYPRRVLRFCGNSTVKALVFGTILARFHHLLIPLFDIETETPGSDSSDKPERPCPFSGGPVEKDRSHAFLIRRKPVPCFSLNTVESTWNGTSRIFHDRFSIKLDRQVRIGVTLPPI